MDAAHYREEGNRHFKERRWKEAAEQYELGLKKEPPADVRGLLLSNRSQCWLNLSEWQRAFEDADACLKLLPEHSKSLYRRGQAYEKLQKPAEALQDFALVARTDPKNKQAVEATARLREELMRTGEQRRDEALPSHLLSVLEKHDAAACNDDDEVVETCKKLRGICLRQGAGRSLLKAGAVELLLKRCVLVPEASSALKGEALAALFAMVSGLQLEEDAGDRPTRAMPTTEPLPVPEGTQEVRKAVHEKLALPEARKAVKGHGKALRYLALLVGLCHEPEEAEALEAVADALNFVEGEQGEVAQAAVTGLTTMLDARRRLGKLGKPLMPSEALLKCLESALGSSAPVQSLMAIAFTLLADTDRPKGAEVDLTAVAGRVLEPFLTAAEPLLRCNGLAGFAALLAVNVQAGTKLLTESAAYLMAIVKALQEPMPGKEGREAQDHAAECMLLATGEAKTRKQLIEGGAVDTLLGALQDGEECSTGLLRAKVVAVLAIVAGHDREVREEVFDRLDFLLELRTALENARESVASGRDKKQARRLCLGLYESCACLTIHGEFKTALFASKKTLAAMQELMKPEELEEDPQLSFLFASIVYNLCRSREDKVRPKKDTFPFNELEDEDLNAIEEFYEKMPAEARPAKNGEVDAGSKELAAGLRAWCATPQADKQPGAVARLGRCAAGTSLRAKQLAALSFKHLCAEKEHRRYIASSGGVRALLGLVDLEEEAAQNAARQALAQILIVTNPALLPYSEQLDAVRPLVQLLEHRHELLQFEAAMALTNLLTVGEDLRSRALQADGWRACRDLLFSDNEMVQRAGLEAMCNLTMAPEVVERFAEGRAELELRVFASFCKAEDPAARNAAAGALAMLAGSCDEVAVQVAKSENFGDILETLQSTQDPGLQHRLVACAAGVLDAENCPEQVAASAKAALQKARSRGLLTREAEGLARSVLDEGIQRAGGA